MNATPAQSKGLAHLISTAPAYAKHYGALLDDAEAMSFGALKAKYHGEFQSWKNRKHWCVTHQQPWDTRMTSFVEFLMTNGPIPCEGWTLDRIEPTGPYVLENLRWASKLTQSQNRTSAVVISVNGASLTLQEAANALGTTPDAVRMRLNRRGNEHVASQLRSNVPTYDVNSADPIYLWRFPKECAGELEALFQKKGRGHPHRYSLFKALLLEAYKGPAVESLSGTQHRRPEPEVVAKIMRLHRFAVRQLRVLRLRAFLTAEAEHKQQAEQFGLIFQPSDPDRYLPYRGAWDAPKEFFSGEEF